MKTKKSCQNGNSVIDKCFLFWQVKIAKIHKRKGIALKLTISEGQLSRIISGTRTPDPFLADMLSKLTRTNIGVWLFNTQENILLRKKWIDSPLDLDSVDPLLTNQHLIDTHQEEATA